jgi:hypothetical protein
VSAVDADIIIASPVCIQKELSSVQGFSSEEAVSSAGISPKTLREILLAFIVDDEINISYWMEIVA